MSREKAKEILYKHEEKSGGAINHWQADWILDAMEEYSKVVKANGFLGAVIPCECGKNGRYSENAGKVLCSECFSKTIS